MFSHKNRVTFVEWFWRQTIIQTLASDVYKAYCMRETCVIALSANVWYFRTFVVVTYHFFNQNDTMPLLQAYGFLLFNVGTRTSSFLVNSPLFVRWRKPSSTEAITILTYTVIRRVSKETRRTRLGWAMKRPNVKTPGSLKWYTAHCTKSWRYTAYLTVLCEICLWYPRNKWIWNWAILVAGFATFCFDC